MKKGVIVIILIFIVIVFFGVFYYLYVKNQELLVVFKIEKVEIKMIVKNMIVIGNIQLDEEVLIKFNILGIIEFVYIKVGEKIKVGDMIVKIKVVVNVFNVSSI